ncbi:MAG: class I SAM-dependent methyltransferase [Candidatus Omnitrophica bacterium]|nr:class I SAM-dependent methyltransferase [Candidatus Omnitrophota bacterium]
MNYRGLWNNIFNRTMNTVRARSKRKPFGRIAAKDHYGFSLFSHWHCRYSQDPFILRESAPSDIEVEPRIKVLLEKIDIRGLRVLELGSLEGAHAMMLEGAGAGEIISIEGREENFLKCLVAKNALRSKRCTFLLGDLNEVVPQIDQIFDLCLAVGILYHLPDPVKIMYHLGKISRNIFVWTHCIPSSAAPKRLVHIEYQNNRYRGTYAWEDSRIKVNAVKGKVFWLCEDDLVRLINDAGFSNIDIIGREQRKEGQAITLCARR